LLQRRGSAANGVLHGDGPHPTACYMNAAPT
jgi:hypothetical protein